MYKLLKAAFGRLFLLPDLMETTNYTLSLSDNKSP